MIQLSVIIPTRNRAKSLYSTLLSFENQSINQDLFEIIVCDNNSDDNTPEIASFFANKFVNFKYIKTLEPGLHVGRNKGFQEAKGGILVYADDDIEAFPEWLYTINEVFKDKDVVLVGGKNLPKWEINPPDWIMKLWEKNENGERILLYYSILDLGDEIKQIRPHYVWGCNFAVRKQIIAETQGFHPDGMPQEIIQFRGDGETAISDYIDANGYKTIYHPGASIYHLVPKQRLTLEYLKKWSFNAKVGESYTDIRAGRKVNLSFFNIIRSYFSFHLRGKYLERDIYLSGVKGYRFHQQKVKRDPELKEWVLKNNYL